MSAMKDLHIEITQFVERVLSMGLAGSNGGIHPTGLTNLSLAAFAEGCDQTPSCQAHNGVGNGHLCDWCAGVAQIVAATSARQPAAPSPIVTLRLDKWGELLCPQCGQATLAATIQEVHRGCALSYAGEDGSWLGLFDADTWDGDHVEADLVRITCKSCDFAIADPQAGRIGVAEAEGQEVGNG